MDGDKGRESLKRLPTLIPVHASTGETPAIVGPIAGSGKLEAVQALDAEPVRVRSADPELSGSFSHSLRAMAAIERPVIEEESRLDERIWTKHCARCRIVGYGGIEPTTPGNLL